MERSYVALMADAYLLECGVKLLLQARYLSLFVRSHLGPVVRVVLARLSLLRS